MSKKKKKRNKFPPAFYIFLSILKQNYNRFLLILLFQLYTYIKFIYFRFVLLPQIKTNIRAHIILHITYSSIRN
jgi:hypothetical protein